MEDGKLPFDVCLKKFLCKRKIRILEMIHLHKPAPKFRWHLGMVVYIRLWVHQGRPLRVWRHCVELLHKVVISSIFSSAYSNLKFWFWIMNYDFQFWTQILNFEFWFWILKFKVVWAQEAWYQSKCWINSSKIELIRSDLRSNLSLNLRSDLRLQLNFDGLSLHTVCKKNLTYYSLTDN